MYNYLHPFFSIATLTASLSPRTLANSEASIPSPSPKPYQKACTLLVLILCSCAATSWFSLRDSPESSLDKSLQLKFSYLTGDITLERKSVNFYWLFEPLG